MRALVTGIAGFAGSHLAEYLLASGDPVLGALRPGSRIPCELGGTDFIEWDISGEMSSTARLAVEQFRPEVIFHLAAISVPRQCGESEPNAEALATNVEGTRRVVELCETLNPRPRMLFVSTSKVYARASGEQPFVDESAPVGPETGYGKSKLAAEQLVREAVAGGRLDAVIVRAFQHAGPRQQPPMMLPEWASQFAQGTDPIVVQRLRAGLDFSDVRDVVRAYRALAERGDSGAVYNVGSGRILESGQILAELRQLADPARGVAETFPERKQDPVAIIDRLRGATGWSPKIDWRQTVADVWNYWKTQARPLAAGRSEA